MGANSYLNNISLKRLISAAHIRRPSKVESFQEEGTKWRATHHWSNVGRSSSGKAKTKSTFFEWLACIKKRTASSSTPPCLRSSSRLAELRCGLLESHNLCKPIKRGSSTVSGQVRPKSVAATALMGIPSSSHSCSIRVCMGAKAFSFGSGWQLGAASNSTS